MRRALTPYLVRSRGLLWFYIELAGVKPWTRIEETAIRNRAYDHGYGFVIFVPLDESSSVPKWLPRTQLWVGLKRWGMEGAAAAIEARVQELGGEPHDETVLDRAARLERSLNFSAHRKQFLNSEASVGAANAEFESLRATIEGLAAEIRESASSISLQIKSARRQIVILGFGLGMSLNWNYPYANSLDNAKLDVVLWDGYPQFPSVIGFEQPKKRRTISFTFDLLAPDQPCWLSSGINDCSYSTKDFASFILKYFMEQGEAIRARK